MSSMPRFQKGSEEAKEWGKQMLLKKQQKSGKGFLDSIAKVGKTLGEPFQKTTGVNPFTIGYDAGYALGNKIKGNGIKRKKMK